MKQKNINIVDSNEVINVTGKLLTSLGSFYIMILTVPATLRNFRDIFSKVAANQGGAFYFLPFLSLYLGGIYDL